MENIPMIIWGEEDKDENAFGVPCKVVFLGDDLEEVWKSNIVHIENIGVYERPTCSLVHDDMLYLGLNTGVVKKIDRSSGATKTIDRFVVDSKVLEWDRYGGRDKYNEHQRYLPRLMEIAAKDKDFAERLKLEEENRRPILLGIDSVINGLREINGLVEHEGTVYDASSMGLFETEQGHQVLDDWVSSVVVYDGRLCVVPVLSSLMKRISGDGKYKLAENAKDLVDVLSGKVIVENLTPMDGSGCRQAEYCIVGDTVYVHHGNWPGERITRRSIVTGEEIGNISIPTTSNLFEHQGMCFDHRSYDNKVYVAPSNLENFPKESWYHTQESISAVSGGDQGILVAEYNNERNSTRLFILGKSRDIPRTSIEVKGHATFLR